MIEATFASGDINLGIELEANINLGAIIAAGLGGILFSDLRVAVTLGEPFNTTILEVYYLGSSRLVKQGNIYDLKAEAELTAQQQGAFSDAIYIDASGLGLGKIKFQGIAGLLGGNVGNAYQGVYQSGAATAAEPEDTDATAEEPTTISIALGIDLAENYIGINIDKSLIDFVLNNLLGETLATAGISSLPDIQSLELAFAFGTSSVDSISLDATVDGAGTGLHLTIDDLALGLENTLDTEDLVNKVKKQFAGITYSKTAGVMTLLQSLLEGINPNLSINIDRRAETVMLDTAGENYTGVGRDLMAKKVKTNSTVSLVSSYDFVSRTGNGLGALGGTTSINDYMITLGLTANHPESASDETMKATVYFGNNNAVLADVEVGSLGWADGLGDALGLLNWIDLGSVIGSGQLFPSFAYGDDRDTGSWSYGTPVATTASDGAAHTSADETQLYGASLNMKDGKVVTNDYNGDNSLTNASSFTTPAKASATNVNKPYKYAKSADGKSWTSGYSYKDGDLMSILSGLVNKVEVNLFNRNGYQPYLSGMQYVDPGDPAKTDASLVSVKVELTKDGYNELMIFLYTTILSLLHVAIDVNGQTTLNIDGSGDLSTGVAAHESNTMFYYFSYDGPQWLMGGALLESRYDFSKVIRRHNASNSEGPGQWVISNLFAELDSIDYIEGISEHEKTELRVQLLTPYVRSIPVALFSWVIRDLYHLGSFLGGVAGNVRQAFGSLTALISTLLPTFASYDDSPNPSLNIYIDLDPQATMYGFNDGRVVAPGIQAIELMVNAEKYEYNGGKTLNGVNDSGGEISNQTLYKDPNNNNSHGTLKEAYVLSINPRNLVTPDEANKVSKFSGEGLFSLLEASGLPSGDSLGLDGYSIEVDDVGTKSATVYNNGSSVNSGTLNADLLLGANLPTTANVLLVGQSGGAHNVPIVWDAGALDFSPSALEKNNRLAGYVYGYALNLVVAMIPVYVTGGQYYEGVYEVNNGGKGAAVSLNWTGGDTAIADDLVYIEFRNGTGYVFGKQAVDAEGNPLTAVLRTGAGQYQQTDGVYNIYPLYTALAVDEDAQAGYDKVMLDDGVEYYIIDTSNSGGVLPVGTFSWDLNGLDYGWDGTDGGKTVTVGISYQWGFSATQTHDVTLSISSALIDSVESGYTYTGRNGLESAYGSWSDFAAALGLTDKTLAEARTAIVEYFNDLGITDGNFVTADGSPSAIDSRYTVVGWDLTELLNAMARRPGRNVTVDITMYVGGFNVWKELQETDLGVGGAWEYVRGFADDFLINVEGAWVMNPSADQVEKVYNNVGGNMGFVAAAQPVTVTISIGEEGGFEWATPAAPAPAPTPDTYVFSDGSSATQQDGVMTYTITTAAQLYGAMPESGSVVQPDGTAMKAKFDWNPAPPTWRISPSPPPARPWTPTSSSPSPTTRK